MRVLPILCATAYIYLLDVGVNTFKLPEFDANVTGQKSMFMHCEHIIYDVIGWDGVVGTVA